MKAANLSHQTAVGLVTKPLPGKKLVLPGVQKWDVLIVVKECDPLSSRFQKSLSQNIDDSSKRSQIIKAIDELYRAICDEKYQDALAQSGVTCKVAHSFTYMNSTFKVWELKPSNKDRIYFFPLPEKMNGRKTLFLLLAYHKKDQQTPKDIKDYCEESIKEILQSKEKISICKEKK
jgi:hypothetical protein